MSTAPDISIPAGSNARLNTTGKPVDLVVPLRERVPLGQVAIRIMPDDKVLISKVDVAAAVRRIADPRTVQAIERLADENGLVDLSVLNIGGMSVRIDPNLLEIVVSLAADNKAQQTIGFGFSQDQPVRPDTSSNFAAFLNYQANWDYEHRGQEKGFQKPRANFAFDGRVLRHLTFENEFSYDGNSATKFSRFGSRVFYEMPKQALRIGAGDLTGLPIYFQDSADVLGVGVSKLLTEFRPDRIFTATAGQQLTLNQSATVTIVVNGVPVRNLALDPGNYNFSDLPLVSGANNVELIIEDSAGGRRVVAFDFFQDTLLLAKGVDEYDAKLGIRSDYIEEKREYFRHEPVITGFYRRGLSEQLTAGFNLQATRDRQQAGLEAAIGTSFGLFGANLAASRNEEGNGIAGRLQYRNAVPLRNLPGARRFDALVEYRSMSYGGIESFRPNNTISWILAARFSQPVTAKLSGGVGIDYRIGRGDTKNRYSAIANASYRLRENITINATAGYNNVDKATVGISVFWRRSRSDTVLAQYDSRYNDASIAYTHSPQKLLDTIAWGVGAVRSGSEYGVNGTATWRTNRGDFEIAHRSLLTGDTNSNGARTTSLRARGTLAFADGKFAIGRYFSDSFTIVSGHKSLRGAQILVGGDVNSMNPQAKTDWLGPALVPISSYSNSTIYYAVPEAPPGYDFGSANFTAFPYLHSGHRQLVGSAANMTMFGTLLDDRGTPLALVAGRAVSLDDAKLTSVELFTNREGRIGATGLSPGRWRIEAGRYTYDVVIEENENAYVDVSTLSPTGTREIQR